MSKLESFVKNRISQLREEHSFTHRDMADKMNLKSVASYYVIENGNARVTVPHIEKFCDIYRLSPSEFFGETHFAEDAHEKIPADLLAVYEEIIKNPDKLAELLRLYVKLKEMPDDLISTLSAMIKIQ